MPSPAEPRPVPPTNSESKSPVATGIGASSPGHLASMAAVAMGLDSVPSPSEGFRPRRGVRKPSESPYMPTVSSINTRDRLSDDENSSNEQADKVAIEAPSLQTSPATVAPGGQHRLHSPVGRDDPARQSAADAASRKGSTGAHGSGDKYHNKESESAPAPEKEDSISPRSAQLKATQAAIEARRNKVALRDGAAGALSPGH